jgi:hypothetical protein
LEAALDAGRVEVSRVKLRALLVGASGEEWNE